MGYRVAVLLLIMVLAFTLQVFPGVDYLTTHGAKFENDEEREFDAIVLATGYRSNVPQWLQVIPAAILD